MHAERGIRIELPRPLFAGGIRLDRRTIRVLRAGLGERCHYTAIELLPDRLQHGPNANYLSNGFGNINGYAGSYGARQLQVAVKFYY
jgi:hypothetical protein